mmetsp:Transcript_149820/g.481238  ORF Transcript_149820/g.481238 Transcript_149820/m.481238 type:complete len:81 (+) Transcript_149820:288-530(+)
MRHCHEFSNDIFLRAWLALYSELARLAEPLEIDCKVQPDECHPSHQLRPGLRPPPKPPDLSSIAFGEASKFRADDWERVD